MKRLNFSGALAFTVAISALVLSGCATVDYRISHHPEIYQRLSPSDQALVSQGQIREGMAQDAVFLAWGSPDQQGVGRMNGHQVETWIYRAYYSAYDPYSYGYGGFGYGGYGGIGYVGRGGFHHGHRFYGFYYDPFDDPFFYPHFVPVSYPYKTATFRNGRVVAFQTFTPPRA